MRLVTYRMATPLGEQERYGALDGDDVVDLPAGYEAMLAARPRGTNGGVLPAPTLPATLLGLLHFEDAGMEAARAALDFARAEGVARVPREQVRLRPPLPRPNSIRDFMLVEEHVLNAMGEVPEEWYRIPVYWKANADAVYGPEDEVPWPAYTEKLDYELELCAVVGRRGRSIGADDAAAHIAGYSIFNDWSARDIQLREMSVGIGPGLGKDFATSIGPCLVTPDELDPQTAPMTARVNGDTWSQGTAGEMRFTFPEVIAHLSEEQELVPGDVLASGTVGRGCGFELDRWLKPDDVVELEVEGIGVLRNRVRRRQREQEG